MQRNDRGGPRAASLSAVVVLLLMLAVLTITLGFARLPDPLLELGVVAVGLFLAVSARICQAREQHLALCRVLEERQRFGANSRSARTG